jgi:acyl-CoA thioester hydrolase
VSVGRWDDVTAHVEHRVTFSETDAVGYAHHRCVAVWFEQAREAYFRRFGIPAVELYKKGWLLAVRQLNVRYDSFLGYEDQLSIRVALTKLGRVACDFHYRVDNLTTGKLAVRGHTNMVAVDDKGKGNVPALSRIHFDRGPLEKLLVSTDDLFDAPQGAWKPPRWEPE